MLLECMCNMYTTSYIKYIHVFIVIYLNDNQGIPMHIYAYAYDVLYYYSTRSMHITSRIVLLLVEYA